ncbi:hypothetical protein QN277_010564 [Acacia crassicarpa]|uniref:CBM20 domain-containing protein n=1 Tax=Acacia crassicarpa TaxID=499986 RepID=A0AAE1JKQ8_9FABA|nr:hypothetical protein QN277_010564 [Acacia crassicarpa]
MESLTSSCSKPVLDGLASSSSSLRLVSAFHFSDRLEFSFSNGKVGNFRFLRIVQNKGISPVHAVPYEPQVDLETEEPRAQETEETKFVRIKFQLQKDCMFGEQFLIVGDHPMIGAWDPSNALPMTWSEGHQWFVETDVPAEKSIQYKFILKSVSGDIIWQPGPDRIVRTWETDNRITVCEDWENAELQKIVEEEQLDYSNGKPMIDSEISNFSENLDLPEEEMVSDVTDALDFEDSKTHLEEKPLAQPDVQQIVGDISSSSSMEKPMPMVAENIDSSDDVPRSKPLTRGVNNMEEKPLAQPDVQQIVGDISSSSSSSMEKPMPMVAENIDSSDDVPKNKPRTRGVNNMALRSEVTVHDLEQMSKVSEVNDQGKEVVKGNLFEFEGSPVLVPGLTPPETEETTNDKVEERITMDNSVEAADETKDQNMPEVQFKEEKEESDDGVQVNEEEKRELQYGKPQEKAETLSDEPELVDNEFQEKFHSTAEIVKVSDVHKAHENVLENDIQWGRGILRKILSKIGFL